MQSEAFAANPIGLAFDPDALLQQHRNGAAVAQLREKHVAASSRTRPILTDWVRFLIDGSAISMGFSHSTRLGVYELVSPLGAGGMGEVYRALDTRLRREVALKLLPAALSQDAERMARFHREAQLLAALNHPNIAAIYGMEESGSTHALVMELVEGPTLQEQMFPASGRPSPLPVEEALSIARQIVDALEYSHERGIIHRDLKPANIKITPDGKIKVLDFGLAKAMESKAPTVPPGPTMSPTLTLAATQEGMILGTAAYMSPEQAKGKPVDRRADIWSFGVVLYEMLTGSSMFPGETVTDVLAAVLTRQPDWKLLPDATPAAVRRLLARCLEKDPRQRLRDIGEARIALEEAVAHPPTDRETAEVKRSTLRERAAWLIAAVALVVAAAALAWKPSLPPRPLMRVLLTRTDKPMGVNLSPSSPINSLAISPDGSRIVFESGGRLWLRPINDMTVQPLTGTEGASYPFWSPDSRQIGFTTTGGKLKTSAVDGGPPVVVCDAPDARGAAWGPDGTIVITPNIRAGLFKVAATGGRPEPLTTPDPSLHTTHRWPSFLPDGKHVLYLAANHERPKGEQNGLYVTSLDGAPGRLIVRGLSDAIYSSGYLLFIRDNTLLAQAFDPASLALIGVAARLADDAGYDPGTWRANISATATGLLAYITAGASAGAQLTWMDRTGKILGTMGERQPQFFPRLSPDQRKVVLLIGDPSSDVWIQDTAGTIKNRITFTGLQGVGGRAAWSPDGRRVVFTGPDSKGQAQLFVASADGTVKPQILHPEPTRQAANDWSPDGRYILYERGDLGASDLYLMPADGKGDPAPLVATPAWEKEGAFSPDGRWVAYVSRETGRDEVYVTSSSGSGKWQVSTSTGWSPRWSGNARELFYLAVTDSILNVVEVTGQGQNFSSGTARPLFRLLTSVRPGSAAEYDVARDGRRILANSLGEAKPEPIALLVNWTSLLKSN